MKAVIFPSKLTGTISAPPSKSYTHRAIILASLGNGKSRIKNPLISDDAKATISACESLGVKIKVAGTDLIIGGIGGKFSKLQKTVIINCGLSGTTARLMTAIATLSPNKILIDGEKRLQKRPMKDLVEALIKQGVKIKSPTDNFFLPLTIEAGKLTGGTISLSGNVSSQFISALLLIAPFAKTDTTLIVSDIHSKPYIDITIYMMKTFGVDVEAEKNRYSVKAGQRYKAQEYTMEGDYSSASYFLAAETLTDSKIKIDNLNKNSVQGDKYFLDVLEQLKSNNQERIFDLGNYPDIVPTVAVVAAQKPGTTKLENIGHLRTKETDRIHALASELKKMKAEINEGKNWLSIIGGKLTGAEIDTYNDHRIAMSFAIAGLTASGKTVINNAEVVNKSYPAFWIDMQKLGAKITIIN